MRVQDAILLLGVAAPAVQAQQNPWAAFLNGLRNNQGAANQPAVPQQGANNAVAQAAVPAAGAAPVATGKGLDGLFKAKGKKYFGTATDTYLLNGQSASIIQQQFGQVTHENSLKWDATEPSRGRFNYGNADTVVNFATKNNLLVRGHTLLWHSQLPGWVNSVRDKAQLTQVIENHVTNVVTHYKGKIYAWDVVNEILDENGGLRRSIFTDVLGDAFVGIAFRAARKADPAAKLYINDYNLDAPNAIKTRTMIQKVTQWRAQGIPIDGIGTQTHLEPGMARNTGALLKALCAAADECAITELDIKNASPSDYSAVTTACLAEPKCVGITVWGVSDKDSWRRQNNPLLYDGNFRPKPAFQAVVQASS